MNAPVLILDDSLTIRMNLKEAFEGAGFATYPCATAQEARAVLDRQKIDLVVLDVQLPDADGIDFLQKLKSGPNTKSIPVIVLSSEVEAGDRGRGISGGADEYVGKPYNVSYVIAKAQELLRSRSGAAVPSRAKPLVLVIDDSPTYREALKGKLAEKGYDVQTAENGEDGIKAAVRLRPDAMIVDGNLPGIDGATVVRRIKSDVTLRGTPCLLLTASKDQVDESRALDAGADSYARKDDDAEGIAARLIAILKSAARASSAIESGLLSPKRILAVDDSRTYIEALAEPLREEGYDVILAMSGEEALAILVIQRVDCILLDRMMPGLSGQEVCEKIKANQQLRDIPVLMLTAFESREAMLESFSAGADDYVPKSSEFDVLKARVRAQLRRKQFEDESRRVQDELVRAETRARLLLKVEQANADLERANRELESFSYTVSHDLKVPLRSMIGFSEILLQDHAKNLNAEGADYLQRVAASARRMGQLIDDLLEMSQTSRHELKAESVDLSALARAVAKTLGENNAGRKVDWVIADGIQGYGDPVLLGSVLQNLLANAWKYSSKKSSARIEFGSEARDGKTVYFVRDNGAGFDPAHASKLFTAFERLHSKDEFEGTGIGLASVRRVVERHGGKIWATAKLNEGASFFFTLSGPE